MPHARDRLRDEALLLVAVDEQAYAREVCAAGVSRLREQAARARDVVLERSVSSTFSRGGQKPTRGFGRAAERVGAEALDVERAGEGFAHAAVVEGRARGVEAVVVERGEGLAAEIFVGREQLDGERLDSRVRDRVNIALAVGRERRFRVAFINEADSFELDGVGVPVARRALQLHAVRRQAREAESAVRDNAEFALCAAVLPLLLP